MKYLCTKLVHSSSVSCVSIAQKVIQVKPTCNWESNASCSTESLITAIPCVLLTGIEDAETVMVRESEKQQELPGAPTGLT